MITQFTKLVLIGIAIAIPFTWYFLHEWLKDYAYRTTLSWWVFALPALLALALATLMVSIQAIRASKTNPAVSLRHQ